MKEILYGRQLLTSELLKLGFTTTDLRNLSARDAMIQKKKHIYCVRCGSTYLKKEVELPGHFYYCPGCIRLNRVTSNQKLYTLPEANWFEIPAQVLTWQGELTSDQARISRKLIHSFQLHQRHLLWAVTGAGKTEMLFPLLAYGLQSGARIGVVSPRVDVCNELYPRLQRAFANTPMQLRHGQQQLPYQYTQLTVATTHQLLRYYRAFDLLIVDEVDAFPYVDDRRLAFATQQAIKKEGMLLYLTATPTPALFKEIRQKKLKTSYLTRRYHGRPLPLPKLKYQVKLSEKLTVPTSIRKLRMALQKSLTAKRQILIFVPKIKLLPAIFTDLKKIFSCSMDTVYGEDPQRQEKVQQFRDKTITVLLTTTILERGVTFSNIDVYVLQADDRIFSAASLVQIAGRAGRDANYPNGSVFFFYERYTRQIQSCQNQIRYMNKKVGS